MYGESNQLAWIDKTGKQQSFGPTHISHKFWTAITRNGVLTVKQTKLRYLDTDPAARPVIMADADERRFQDNFGVWAGLIGIAVGLVGALMVVRRMIRL